MTAGRAPMGAFVPGTACRPIQHGTTGGYRAHFRHGEPMCEPCRDAERKRMGYKGPRKTAVCGTPSGYQRHLNRTEQPCAPCRAAKAKAKRERPRPGLPAGDPRHGTCTGYEYWGCRCPSCYHVKAANNRRQREARRGRA